MDMSNLPVLVEMPNEPVGIGGDVKYTSISGDSTCTQQVFNSLSSFEEEQNRF